MDDLFSMATIQGLLEAATPTLLKVLAALAIFVAGRWIAQWVVRGLRRMLVRAKTDYILVGFLGNLLYALLLVAVIIAALEHLGMETTSLLAILGAAGLAVGLALKDSLSNLSAGVMLILYRPFRAGDFVEAGGVMGVVEDIKMFNTVLGTADNREVIVPNSQIFGGTITNYSARDTRRVDLVIGISYDDDIQTAKRIITEVLAADGRILPEPAPIIWVMELADSSVNIAVRPWVKSADYWDVRSDLLEGMKSALEAAGLSIPYPQHDVYLHQREAR